MAKVISESNLQNHRVDKYNFKVFQIGSSEESKANEDLNDKKSEPQPFLEKDEVIDASSVSKSSKDALIESLMKKTDEMSSNFIKLQMRLESMSDEHKVELQNTREKALQEGVELGLKKAQESADASIKKSLELFSSSVSTLEKSAIEFENALEGIKSHLSEAACDIAQEVISVELKENSNKIATTLSNKLLDELQSASKITLKVNPVNHGAVSKSVGALQKVEIISDEAVGVGGVIVLSDAGNIDSEIQKRFLRVKKAALSE